MNTTFDSSFEPNFREKYKKEDIIEFLQTGNDKQKHYAVLELEDIQSFDESKILVSNLVGQDGKIREAVSFKIGEFVQDDKFSDFFNNEALFETFLEGIMDINGNVCRNIVNMNWSSDFKNYLCKNLPERIRKILKTIAELEKDEMQYKISKRNFQLYWSLEALYRCIYNKPETKTSLRHCETIVCGSNGKFPPKQSSTDVSTNDFSFGFINDVKDIIFACADFEDYTIREKTAKILTLIGDSEFDNVKKKLANDDNYYVRRYIN